MIRLLRVFSNTNRLRLTQCSVRQMCSNKSDDPTAAVLDPDIEDSESKVDLTSTISDNRVDYTKYSRGENNAILIEMINGLPSNPKEISTEALIDFYQQINGNLLITPNVIKHPQFNILREATEAILPQLNTKELKNLFVAVFPSKSVMYDKLGKMIVDALLKRVNYLPFEQIIFLDFLLQKYYKLSELSKDYNILRLTLQTMFLSKVEDALEEVNDFGELMKIVSYCENNSEIIPPRIVNSVTTSLLLVDDDQFNVKHIQSILIMLASFGKLNEHVEKLHNRMVSLWYRSTVTIHQVQVLLKVLAAKSATIDKDRFKSPEFIRHCVNVVTQQTDKKTSFSVQNSFNRLNFVSQDLIEHLSKCFEKDLRELNVADYIIICTACAKANYKPSNWESAILGALKTFKFSLYLTNLRNFDWAEFALNLDKLGYCNTSLMRNIVRSKFFQSQKCYDKIKIKKLEEILVREDALSSDFSEESSSDSSDSEDTTTDDELPLYDDLKRMFGASKIWTNVQIDKKLTIPYALKMDLQTGDFLSFSKAPSIQSFNDNELLIGVVVVPDEYSRTSDRNRLKFAKKQARRTERKGVSSIILEESKWNSLKPYEKSLVFYTKINNMMEFYRKSKLKQMGRDF